MPKLKLPRRAKSKPAETADEIVEQGGLSPNPMTNLLITDLLLRGGGRLLKNGVERAVLGANFTPGKAKKIVKGRSMTQTLVGTALARIATRSVPGAILVGGGMLARALHERRQRAKAAAKGDKQADEQADRGETA